MSRLILFTFLNFLAAMSPGPDFAIVTRYGLTGSRKAALFATLGITAALFIHVFYSLVGVSVLFQQSPWLFSGVQLIGAGYLMYIAIHMLIPGQGKAASLEQLEAKKALKTGFLTNLLNPKATVIILTLFVEFVEPSDSLFMKGMFGLAVPACALVWFSLYSYFLTHPAIARFVQKGQKQITVVLGCLLLCLSVYILFNMISSAHS